MEQKVTASNGINVYYYPQPNTHSICISVYIKTGALYESKNFGITHFLEHLHFRKLGGRTQKELYYQLECIGADFGASTYKEFMRFYLTSSPKYFSNLAVIAADLLGKLEADVMDFNAEKRLVSSEIREANQKDDADYVCNKYTWANTKLQQSVLGDIASIKALTLQELQLEKERAFTRQNVFFYITGNFSDSDILQLVREIERYDLNSRPDTQKDNRAQIPEGFMNRNAFVKLSHRKSFMHDVIISFDVDFSAVSRRELLYLDSILADGLCSLLRAEIIEKRGLIYGFSSVIEQYNNIGVYCYRLQVHKSKLYETIKSFVSVIKGVKKGISELDMAASRVFRTENELELLDDPENLNWKFAYENHILDNNYSDIHEIANANRLIEKEQLVEIANKIFLPNNVLFVSLGHKKGLLEKKLHDIMIAL